MIWGNPFIHTLRVQMIDPCGELHFALDGRFPTGRPSARRVLLSGPLHDPGIMQIDYCGADRSSTRHAPSDVGLPRVDDHMVRPETREELVRDRMIVAMPAQRRTPSATSWPP